MLPLHDVCLLVLSLRELYETLVLLSIRNFCMLVHYELPIPIPNPAEGIGGHWASHWTCKFVLRTAWLRVATSFVTRVCCGADRCVESLQDASGTHVDEQGITGRDSYDEEA